MSEWNEPTCLHCLTPQAQTNKDGRCVHCHEPYFLKEGEYDPFSLTFGRKGTKIVQLIGYWAGTVSDPGNSNGKKYTPQSKEGYPDVRRAVRPAWREDIRDLFRAYLRNGHTVARYLGYSWCRFGCRSNFRRLGTSELSDGEWVWPVGLVHYVERHEVQLPEDFIRSIEARNFEVPAQLPEDYTLKTSKSFWKDWAKQLPYPTNPESLVGKSPSTTSIYLEPVNTGVADNIHLTASFDQFLNDIWNLVLRDFPQSVNSYRLQKTASDIPLARIDELKGPLLEGLRTHGLADLVTLCYTRPDPKDWHKDEDVILRLD